ncbi:hypothetical protein E3H11_42610 [Bradyrhizobium brasilense]|nr:hypothetical protein [Bradyrhizobium brasilense]
MAGWRHKNFIRHCEERQRRSNPFSACGAMDCFASLAMTKLSLLEPARILRANPCISSPQVRHRHRGATSSA